MKGKTFLILLVAAGVLATLTFLHVSDDKHTGDVKMGDKLFADLPVNQVAAVVIADSENTVTLIKGDKKWQVKDRSGFPADFNELRNIVVKLSRLKIGRSFTGSPESLKRLSLLPPSTAEETTGRGKQITLKDPSGKILADIILGQPRETDSGDSGGQYLKKFDGDTIFLVDGNFRFLKSAPAEWLQKEVLNFKADTVASVTYYADDSQTPLYTLSRPKKGETAKLTPVPTGRSVDQAKIDQVFDALAPLSVDDVRASAGNNGPGLTRLVYRLYDGRQITIFPSSAGETYTLRVAAEEVAEEAIADDKPKQASEDSDEAAKTDAADPDATPPVVKTAAQLNEELGAWIFTVQKWQFDSFITQPDALLEALKKEGEGAS